MTLEVVIKEEVIEVVVVVVLVVQVVLVVVVVVVVVVVLLMVGCGGGGGDGVGSGNQCRRSSAHKLFYDSAGFVFSMLISLVMRT
ncbi:hypothetical protein DPMN_001395 [Dreissena polymorpha]|uniref:Transmembrane protein n=1 Tax=Dreissena polymorpha TaxID=45954 RepID=A0A9D4MH73_DREPO|nr:hypothetical protein DPMN_001395 [Dreissena polymorpha]